MMVIFCFFYMSITLEKFGDPTLYLTELRPNWVFRYTYRRLNFCFLVSAFFGRWWYITTHDSILDAQHGAYYKKSTIEGLL